jgi:putative zinc finger/helix-turn-helix YgiT family protein
MKDHNEIDKGGAIMENTLFGYKCQECGQGTVFTKTFPEYAAKIKGYPFIVKDALVGICDKCGTEHFNASETDRWEQAFEEDRSKHYLTANEIQELRKSLGLSMEQFAFLIGTTRQSIFNWERPNRKTAQSRIADLIMKLVRESHSKGKIDVLNFLINDAEQLDVPIKLDDSFRLNPLILRAIKDYKTDQPGAFPLQQLAADTNERGNQDIMLVPDEGSPVGRLEYDFVTASLGMYLIKPLDFPMFMCEIYFFERPALPDQIGAGLYIWGLHTKERETKWQGRKGKAR